MNSLNTTANHGLNIAAMFHDYEFSYKSVFSLIIVHCTPRLSELTIESVV